MDNLEEMDKFLEKHNLLRLNQEARENRNRPITSTEVETVIKNQSKSLEKRSHRKSVTVNATPRIYSQIPVPVGTFHSYYQKLTTEGTFLSFLV